MPSTFVSESWSSDPFLRQGSKSGKKISRDLHGAVSAKPGESLFFCPAGREQDASGTTGKEDSTGGRNTESECSPMERSTLQRGPRPQEYLSKLTDAVSCRDFRDGLVQSSKGGKAQDEICPSHSNRF